MNYFSSIHVNLFLGMKEPRAIHTNHGSRIHCVLGYDDSYLLLLNYDDGDKQWQEHYYSGIPAGLERQLQNCRQLLVQRFWIKISDNRLH